MSPKPLTELVSPDWAEALQPVADSDRRDGRLPAGRAGRRSELPARRAARAARVQPTAGSDVKVLIVGQDPYPTPGHPVGLSFSVDPGRTPDPAQSLQNIYAELQDDLGIPPAATGDLTPWFEQGVLLLNRVLTVQPGTLGIPPRQGLGAGHPARDRGPGRPRRPAGRDPVGPRRPVAGPDARRGAATWPAPTRRRCRPDPASSAPARSAGPTNSWSRAGGAAVDWRIALSRPVVQSGSAGVSRQGVVEVGDQVVDVLDADAEADQVVGDLELRCRPPRRGSSCPGARSGTRPRRGTRRG